MSNYRDDMNDTAVASDRLWVGLRSVAESTARASAVVLTTLGMLVTDAAAASEVVIDRTHAVVTDSAVVSEEVLGTAMLRTVASDGARATDQALGMLQLLLADGAVASDALLLGQATVNADAARAGDEVIDHRTSRARVQDSARVGDALLHMVRERLEDGAGALDALSGRLRARALVHDGAAAGDELLGSATQALVIADAARAAGEALGVLHARDLVSDSPAAAHDELVSLGALVGQVWTAPTDDWAMSRWLVGASGLAVIDGTLYATTPQGVFALDGEDEAITGELRTGAIDLTGGRLGRPHAAYVEYELAGPNARATVTVTTTQSGAPAQYSYPFALRPAADSLTNARALLGRGLRGRHFAFTLTLAGGRAYINDWGVLVAPTNRRI